MSSDRTGKLKAFEFLCDNRLAVLSTVSLENKPESALVYYVVDGKTVYFISSRISRKLRNLLTNDRISLVVFKEFPPLEIQVEGTAETINDSKLKSYIAKLYLEKANKNPQTINWPPVLKLPNLDGFAFSKILIDWFKFSDFSNPEAQIVEGTTEDWM